MAGLTPEPAWANTYCLHTWPLGDLVAHELSPDCVCAPEQSESEIRGDTWLLLTHHSLDQREAREAS